MPLKITQRDKNPPQSPNIYLVRKKQTQHRCQKRPLEGKGGVEAGNAGDGSVGQQEGGTGDVLHQCQASGHRNRLLVQEQCPGAPCGAPCALSEQTGWLFPGPRAAASNASRDSSFSSTKRFYCFFPSLRICGLWILEYLIKG